MRIFAFIPALTAFVTAVACSAIPVDTSCRSRVRCGDVESYIAPPFTAAITYTGVIEVLNSNNKFLGYISKDLCSDSENSCYDPLVTNALIVTFTTGQASNTKLDLTATNLNPPYQFLGLIQGYFNTDSDLKPDSYQYLYLGGISAPGTRPGTPPSKIGNSVHGKNRTAESAVWTYSATSRVLTPQWINTDGSYPHEEFFTQSSTVLYIGGSQDAFCAKFGPVTTVKFKFVTFRLELF